MYKYIFTIILSCTCLLYSQIEPALPPDFPKISIKANSGNLSGDLLFTCSNYASSVYPTYVVRMNSEGVVNFWRKLEGFGTDFKLQKNGKYSYYDTGNRKFVVTDNYFNEVELIGSPNYIVNNHEMVIDEKDYVSLIGDEYRRMDLTGIVPGGRQNATVLGNNVQILDPDRNLIFNWKGFDHFNLTDAAPDIDLTALYIDYTHINSIEIDYDGHILISSRNLDEITKININSGEIIWRLGGKNNQFTFINDRVGFSHQHQVRRLENGNILLFDNGNNHKPQYSRAVEYKLDEENKTATLVWQYRHSPDIYSPAMGNATRLKNGNTLIGWGFNASSGTGLNTIASTMIDRRGNVLFEMEFPEYTYSYRISYVGYDSKNSDVANIEEAAIDPPSPYEKESLTLYPNPFNPSTNIRYSISAAGPVMLKLYDALGTEVKSVRESFDEPGIHSFSMNGVELPGGIYFLRMQTNRGVKTVKAVLLK